MVHHLLHGTGADDVAIDAMLFHARHRAPSPDGSAQRTRMQVEAGS
jgi:hypothetical protein